MLRLLQRGHLKCSLFSFSRFKTLGSSHSWSCPPASSRDPTLTNTVTSSSDSSSLYISTVQSGPPLLLQYSRPRLQTSYFPSAHLVSSPSAPSPPPHARACFSIPPASSSPDSLRVLQELLGVSEPGALNFYILFRSIQLNLFSSINLTLIHLPFSGSLDSLLCNLIAPTPCLALFPPMLRTLAAASSFSSGRAYPSLSFLSSPSPSLDPYSDYVGISISQNNFSSLSFLNVYAPLFALRRIAEPTPFLPAFFPPPETWSI